MRKEIMQALQQEYEQQRLKNSQEELRRRQEVITRCPEIGQYLAERQNLIFGGVRGILRFFQYFTVQHHDGISTQHRQILRCHSDARARLI